jgi:hypothetical protein
MLQAGQWKTAFMKDVWCLHHQPGRWGYDPDQLAQDPRRAGYGPPFTYAFNPVTYVPTDERLRDWRSQ